MRVAKQSSVEELEKEENKIFATKHEVERVEFCIVTSKEVGKKRIDGEQGFVFHKLWEGLQKKHV